MSTALATSSVNKLSLSEARDKIVSLGRTALRHREEAKRATETVMGMAASAGGGVAAAYLEVHMPKTMGFDSDLVASGVLLGASFLGFGGRYGELLNGLGGGVAAVAAYKRALPHMAKK